MANVMSLKHLSNHVSRSGFELSRRNLFTAKIGELLPVCAIETIPGGHYRGQLDAFSRTQPLESSANTRIQEYYDWFFVPYRLLWKYSPAYFTQMSSNMPSADGPSGASTLVSTHVYSNTGIWQQIYDYLKANPNDNLDCCGMTKAYGMRKLLSYLGYGDIDPDVPTGTGIYTGEDRSVNIWRLAAYQKIYNDYYRNSLWESASPQSYNFDYSKGSVLQLAGYVKPLNYDTMFTLRYCNWNKDYLMGLLPSAQFGDESRININGQIGGYYTQYKDGSSTSEKGRIAIDTEASNVLNAPSDFKTDAGFGVLALRNAEFMQKWKEITRSADQDYKDQIKKHFNVDVSDDLSFKCRFLGGQVGQLNISDVVNTNLSSTGDQPDIMGKGIGNANGYFDFEAKEHGVIMCIYHAMPLLDYSSDRLDRMNTKLQFTDYPIPELDRVGMQGTRLHELNVSVASWMPTWSVDKDLFNNIIGYAPRYAEYKTAVDEVHGDFLETATHWVTPLNRGYFLDYFTSLYDHKQTSLDYRFFKVHPNIMDSIFAVNADSTLATDHLRINASFTINSVLPLDYDGLPY